MTTIYKFKRDTTQYQLLVDYDADVIKWSDPEIRAKLEEFLGCELGKGSPYVICCDAYQLAMRNPPEHLEKNFKRADRNGVYDCKIAAKLNKDWVKLCKELGVKTVKANQWALELGWWFGKQCYVHRIDSDYYVEPNGGTFDKDEFLETIDEPTFLRLRADFAERLAKDGE